MNSNEKPLNGGSIYDKKIASGQANRIGAFKKSFMNNEKSRDNSSPYRGLRRNLDENEGLDSKINFPKEEFSSPSTSKHLITQNQEAEAR